MLSFVGLAKRGSMRIEWIHKWIWRWSKVIQSPDSICFLGCLTTSCWQHCLMEKSAWELEMAPCGPIAILSCLLFLHFCSFRILQDFLLTVAKRWLTHRHLPLPLALEVLYCSFTAGSMLVAQKLALRILHISKFSQSFGVWISALKTIWSGLVSSVFWHCLRIACGQHASSSRSTPDCPVLRNLQSCSCFFLQNAPMRMAS